MSENLKLRIIKKASTLFMRDGFNDVTMSRVADSLRMSKRTLYETYDSKEQLILDCFKYRADQRRALLDEKMKTAENTLDFILSVFEVYLGEVGNVSPKLYEEVYQYPSVVAFFEERRQRDAAQAVKFMKRGVDEGLFLPYVNYEIVYHLSNRMLEYVAKSPVFGSFSLRDIFTNTVVTYLRGCTTVKGGQLIDDFVRKNLADS